MLGLELLGFGGGEIVEFFEPRDVRDERRGGKSL